MTTTVQSAVRWDGGDASRIEALTAEVERLRGRVVTDGLNNKARVIEVHVPAGHEAVVRRALNDPETKP